MSPDEFRRFADLLPDVGLLVAKDGSILAANRQVRSLGLSPANLAGRSIYELTSSPREDVAEYLRLCARTRDPLVGSLDLLSENRETIPCRCHGAVAFHDPQGKGTRIFLRLHRREASLTQFAALNQKIDEMHEEIRRRKRVEQRLREQTEWLSATLSSIGDAVITTDMQGRVSFLNPMAEALTGHEATECIGRPLREIFRIVNEQSRKSVENPVERVLREGGVVGLANHTVLIARDGTERPIDDSAAPIRTGNGGSAGVVLVFRDVTERKRFEDELQRQREWLRVTLSSIGDGVIVTNTEGRVTFLNPVAERLTGWPQRQAEGTSLEEVFHVVNESTRQPVENPAAQALRQGRVVDLANQTVLISRDGTERPIDDSAAPILAAGGEVLGAVLAIRDATERRQAERALLQRTEELTQADRRKNEFLAMLSHELRNPLAPIRTGLELLALEYGESEPMRLIQEQVAHIVRLVDDLLDVSRIVRGRIELHKQPVELSRLVESAVRAVAPVLEERTHHFTVSLPPEPLWLNGDPVRLAQVLSNLLHNAAKYISGSGEISITAEIHRGGVVIRVRDTGIGIDAALLPHVFDLFTQSERSIDRSLGGLGIGLTLVRTLVEMHDGTVDVHSEGPGTGSEFIVFLPVLPDQRSRLPAKEPDRRVISRRVLVVDDNVGAATMLRLLLKNCGVQDVVVAHDGPAALEAAKAHQPEIVLLDIGLPRMDGYEVARRLRADPGTKDVLLVAVTGYGQPEDLEKSRAAGFDVHLVKPPDIDSLIRLFSHPKLSAPGD